MAKTTKKASAASTGYSAATSASALIQTTPRPVMEIGQATIYGGTTELLGAVPHLKLLLDLSSCPASDLPSDIVEGNVEARKQLPRELFIPSVPVLHLNWPDGQAGHVDMEWWLGLIRWIETLNAPASVGVGCMGGRGRTGTALACLAALSGQSGETDPVEYVRNNYIDDAVETETQVQYIEYVTGKVVYEWAANDLMDATWTGPKWNGYAWEPDQKAKAFEDYGARSETAGPVELGPPGMQGSHE